MAPGPPIRDNLQAPALLKTKGTNQNIIQLVQRLDIHNSQSCHPYLQHGLYVCIYVICALLCVHMDFLLRVASVWKKNCYKLIGGRETQTGDENANKKYLIIIII